MKNQGKKLVIMIPCLNEEKTLPEVLRSIPKKITGILEIEIIVIDDGCTDKTIEVAKKFGIKRFVSHKVNEGLAKSFSDGLEEALRLGADIIVNTDGDNQYPQEEIPSLIGPIMEGKADMVIADRQTQIIKHFSLFKKILQWFGSKTVSFFAGVKIPDVVSGFRAYSREAALHLNVLTDYTYTIETTIQAAKKRLHIETIKIKTHPPKRESHLIKNIGAYIKQSAATTLRIFAIYEPLKIFIYIALIVVLPGIILITRFIYLFLTGEGGSHLQSLIIGSFLILIGFQIGLIGLVADLIGINRRKIENILYRIKKMEFERNG